MTEPTDDRPRQPDELGQDVVPPEEQSTIAWTPPDAEPDRAADPGVGSAAIPEAPESAPSHPAAPPEPSPAPPAAPIISASPAAPYTSGWQSPNAAGQPPSGWQLPAGPAAAPGHEGYVIAGVGARIVAWLIDGLLVSIVPGVLSIFLIDWAGLFREIFEAIEADPTGATLSGMTIPITTGLIILTVISTAINYLYFVGFWMSRARATPGMRGLKMQVVDAGSGTTLSGIAATKRWITLGYPLGLLALAPVLQNLAGLGQLVLIIVLFLTTVVDDRHQGLHDKFAGSLMIRSTTSGSGATVIGCLVFGVLAIGLAIVASLWLFTTVGPDLERLVTDMRRSI